MVDIGRRTRSFLQCTTDMQYFPKNQVENVFSKTMVAVVSLFLKIMIFLIKIKPRTWLCSNARMSMDHRGAYAYCSSCVGWPDFPCYTREFCSTPKDCTVVSTNAFGTLQRPVFEIIYRLYSLFSEIQIIVITCAVCARFWRKIV